MLGDATFDAGKRHGLGTFLSAGSSALKDYAHETIGFDRGCGPPRCSDNAVESSRMSSVSKKPPDQNPQVNKDPTARSSTGGDQQIMEATS